MECGEKKENRTYSLRQLLGIIAVISLVLAIAVPYHRWRSWLVTGYEGNQLRKGMTQEQVTAICGPPHEQDGLDDWVYWCDYPSFFSDPLSVGFDAQGRVNWISR